jgi:hypothetical protein
MMHPIRRLASVLVFLAIAALTLLSGCDQRGGPTRGHDRGGAPPPAQAPATTPASDRSDGPQFAPGQLEHHFEKHGGEMGFATKEDYLRAAQALLRGGPDVETLSRANGDTLFFREKTSEFGVLSGRGVIRTYFRPSDGQRYWERQKQR